MRKYLYLIALSALMSGCVQDWESPQEIRFNGRGYRPIYLSEAKAKEILTLPGEALVDPGKIYLLEPYIFVNEKSRGIHIIDNTDPKNPKNISFISIPGNYDMAAKGSWLYADNNKDLLTFDISDPKNVKMVNRTPNVIPGGDYPPHVNIYFECVDGTKGVVVGWEEVAMDVKPKCRR